MKIYLHKYSLSHSPTKKSNGVKSHELGIQLISLIHEITRPGNVLAIKRYSLELPGIWHRLVKTTHFHVVFFNSRQKTVGYHMTTTLRISSDSVLHEKRIMFGLV